MEKQKIIIMLNCLVMHKSFWKLQLPWTFHCLLYPEGGELESEVSSLFSGTPNTRVVSLNMEVLKVLNSSLSWENGSIKGLQGLGFKAWAMCRKSWSLILPSTKTLGGAFWTQLFPWWVGIWKGSTSSTRIHWPHCEEKISLSMQVRLDLHF